MSMFFRYVLSVLALTALQIMAPAAMAQDNGQTDNVLSQIDFMSSPQADAPVAAPAQPGSGGNAAPNGPQAMPEGPQTFDYSVNLNSDVFGANLFTGAFARQGGAQFNPDYVINVGDSIQVLLWGAYQFQSVLTVDPQGNIFLPNVGPVRLLGVRNKDLQSVVDSALGRVFRTNVFSYASLAAAQPVRVYVGGYVHRPGAYPGTSMDSILHYLDLAGGIDPDRGSFLNVQVKRGTNVRAHINLYDFLLNGEIPQVQLADGDVIFVAPRTNTVRVEGLAENAKRFEFTEPVLSLGRVAALAKPQPEATHVRVVRAHINLYDFLLNGEIPQVQLADGDVIFVAPRTNTVRVEGLAENAKRFEFTEPVLSLGRVAALAKPQPEATHVRVVRNTGVTRNVEYYPLASNANIVVQDGDELAFTADKKPGTITVRVEGEHESAQEYVLPYGAHMGELLSHIEYSERSDRANLQLFRKSVKKRQKELLDASLRSLETAALTARSGTSDEARLRKDEADLILRWVDRAKKIEPNGQVVISQATDMNDLLLENGDVIRVPVKDGLVLVSGEVLFPNAVAYDRQLSVGDYINRAGGFTNNADASRIIVARQDGSFAEADRKSKTLKFGSTRSPLSEGDEILVLPKIDVKSRQIFKDMTQILYQIAISAKVALGL